MSKPTLKSLDSIYHALYIDYYRHDESIDPNKQLVRGTDQLAIKYSYMTAASLVREARKQVKGTDNQWRLMGTQCIIPHHSTIVYVPTGWRSEAR